MKSSLERASATSRNSGRSSTRPNSDDDDDRGRGLQQRRGEASENRFAAVCSQYRDKQQDRNDGKILREQNREARPSDARSQAFLAGQEFKHDGG